MTNNEYLLALTVLDLQTAVLNLRMENNVLNNELEHQDLVIDDLLDQLDNQDQELSDAYSDLEAYEEFASEVESKVNNGLAALGYTSDQIEAIDDGSKNIPCYVCGQYHD